MEANMAKPIPVVLKPPEISSEADVRAQLQRKLADAPVEHAAAVLSFYELIQAMHNSGTTDLLCGLFGARDNILGRVAAALNAPEAVRTVRNLVALAQIVGSVDPKVFESLRDAITEVAEKNKQPSGKPPGLWKIVKRADSEDSLRTLSATTDFLESFGRHLKEKPEADGGSN